MSSWLCSFSMNYAPAKMDVNTKASSYDYEINGHPQHRQAFGVSALLCYCVSQTLIRCSCFGLLWLLFLFFFIWHNRPHWVRASSFTRFLDYTQRRTTVGRTPLDGWLTHRRYLCLATHITHNKQTSMPPVGFEPTISWGERPHGLRLRPHGHWDRPPVFKKI
jgi:hypothetical protein